MFFVILIIILTNNHNDTYKIAKDISKTISNSTIVEEGKDNDFDYSYQESTLIYVDEVGAVKSENFAIAISKYNSNMEANYKNEYLNNLLKLSHEKLDNTHLSKTDDYKSYYATEKNIRFVKGTYLIVINSKLDNKEEIKNTIERILNDYNTKDISKPEESKIKKYWETQIANYSNEIDKIYQNSLKKLNDLIMSYVKKLEGCKGKKCLELIEEIKEYEEYPELSESITSVKNKYNEIIKSKEDKVNVINNSISNLNESLDQNQYDSIKKQIEEIDELDDSYYNEYIKKWNLELNNVEEQVYKKSCSSYGYKDLLRNPNDYAGKKAYFFGQILQKVSSTQYRVGIDCTKYHYIDGYSCTNTIYVTYHGDTSVIENDMVEMWGTMTGTKTYTTIMGASVTIPNFSAKYITIQ